ncbi:hypothetical protein [Thalassospira australica]|uniref:hypothetical protein n=1 Tax=Thalassospira australica TaxID=1528106 RepID=UPI00384E80AF
MMAFLRSTNLALALLLAGPLPALAHGAGWQIDQSQSATVYQFGYTDGTAMMFAEVTITGPDGNIWQKGRTDRAGHFAVATPSLSRDGETGAHWRIMVSDGMGHQVILTHSPDTPDMTGVSKPPEPATPGLRGTGALVNLPIWVSILFGISLIANLAFIPVWLRRRQKHRSMQE